MPWRRINWLIGRSFFLYLILALLLFGLVNRRAAHNNRMNFLKQSEIDVKAFALGAPDINPAMLRMAARYYQELLRLLPSDGAIHGNLGFCYFYLKDYPRAREEYRRALALEPQLWTLHWDSAMFLFQSGNVKEAARILENYLDHQDTVREYFKALKGQLRIKKEDVLYLVERMEKRFAEDETETYIKLSEAYFFLKQYDKAKAIAERGLKLFPGNRWLYYVAGGVPPSLMPKDSPRLHLNTELFFLRYHLNGRK